MTQSIAMGTAARFRLCHSLDPNLFAETFNLHAARALAARVPCSTVFQRKAGVPILDNTDISWFQEIRMGVTNDALDGSELNEDDVAAAHNFFEMECLVRVLDAMETVASSEGLAREYVTHSRTYIPIFGTN